MQPALEPFRPGSNGPPEPTPEPGERAPFPLPGYLGSRPPSWGPHPPFDAGWGTSRPPPDCKLGAPCSRVRALSPGLPKGRPIALADGNQASPKKVGQWGPDYSWSGNEGFGWGCLAWLGDLLRMTKKFLLDQAKGIFTCLGA